MTAKKSLEAYYSRQLKELDRGQAPRKKRGRPELEFVQKPCKSWFRKNGWSMFCIDSKAEWNADAQRFVRREDVEAGLSDAMGSANDGTSAWIEFKAPGRRSTLKPHQREFLVDKIQKNCFAICTESVEMLEKAWNEFIHRRAMDPQLSRNFLLKHLPPEPKIVDP